MLPTAESLQPGDLGVTVSEPVVLLRLDVESAGETGGGGGAAGGVGDGGGADGDAGLRVRMVELIVPSGAARLAGTDVAAWQVLLEWTGPGGTRHAVESSTDLTTWRLEPVEPVEIEDGLFRAWCPGEEADGRFYRIRRLP